MRWKVRLSKNPRRASEANEATVFGCSERSKAMTIVPQLVTIVARRAEPTFSDGRSSSPSGLGRGLATFLQPEVVDCRAAALVSVDVVFLSPDDPQPATASSAMRGTILHTTRGA